MKIGDETLLKQLFTLEWSDFSQKLGEYFLEQLNETNEEILDDLTTLIDTTLTGDNMYKVYTSETLRVSSERYFSLVNTYNIIRFGAIKTYVDDGLEG